MQEIFGDSYLYHCSLYENIFNDSNYNFLATTQSPTHCQIHSTLCPCTAMVLSSGMFFINLFSISFASMIPEEAPCRVKMGNGCFLSALSLNIHELSKKKYGLKKSNKLHCAIDFPLTSKLPQKQILCQLLSEVKTVC